MILCATGTIPAKLAQNTSYMALYVTDGTSLTYCLLPTAPNQYLTFDANGIPKLSTFPTLSTVAISGAYSDLGGLPSLGTASSQSSTDFATAAQGTLAASALQSFTEEDPIASPALTTHAALSTTAHGGIVSSSDSRLSNARTPSTHASSHVAGAGDPISGLMIVDSGWTANTYSGLKSAVLVTYSQVISGTMSTALNLTSAGLGASLVTMDQTIQLLVQQLAGLRTALVAGKLPNT